MNPRIKLKSARVENILAQLDFIKTPPVFVFVLLGVLISMAAAGCSAEQVQCEQTQRFKQDRFAIGFWVDPPADKKMDQRYKEIAEANFSLVIGGFGAADKKSIVRQIALCEKYDLKVLISALKFEAGKLLNSPACWGIRMRDEPSVEEFGRLRSTVEKLRNTSPGKLGYINLFPSYAASEQLGTDSYEDYVNQFVNEVDPDVLCMDHYPMMKPDDDRRQGYCDDLAVMRKYALEKEIPFWNFFNVMPFGPHLDPAEAQIRWQIYTSLAYGAKGVLYFCYYTPLSDEFPKGGAIITRDDRKTRHYAEAQRINRAIKNLGPTLMKLTNTVVYRIKPEDDPAAVLKGSPITQLTPGNYLVGIFEHEDGRQAVLLNNYDFAYSSWPTVTFNAPMDRVYEIDQQTSNEIPVLDDSPDMDGLQISLNSGAGRLFIIKKNPEN